MSVDWAAARAEFPALANWTYLNTATFGQLPRRATEAVAQHFAHRDELACWDFLDWFHDVDRLRAKIGRLIRCQPEDVAFAPNTAAALAILLNGLDWRAGDRILTLEHEFPNNLYAPGLVANSGVEMIECPWERLYESVDSRTRLVAISSVNYNNGFAPPLEELSAFLHQRGVLLFIDGTQSMGALRFDASRIRPDMLAVHGYKWLISPNGAGFFYVHPELRARLRPNVLGWRSHRDWRNVDNLHHGVPELTESAEKYEGGWVSVPLLYAMEASIDLVLEIGTEVIEQRVLELASKTRDILRGFGASVDTCASPIVAARFENRDVSALARALKEKRVLVAARRGHLRVSPHFYNNEADLDKLSTALRDLL
ncbi:MAG TPA: aminotransferase class V-fold PLP-dependent enzyme [Bryobacteraceae bacterium]|nr:aminotransferase class V-fold PLP-dependent enzyme [Bryobacteraceae bacterium]